MSRAMLPEQTWKDICALFVSFDGDGAALIRVVRAAIPEVALGFVNGGAA